MGSASYQRRLLRKGRSMKCQKCEDANDPVKLRAEIDALRKRNAKNEDDAARYRWLRDSKNAYPLFFIAQRDPNNIVVQFTGELADMNIDEMMKTPND